MLRLLLRMYIYVISLCKKGARIRVVVATVLGLVCGAPGGRNHDQTYISSVLQAASNRVLRRGICWGTVQRCSL